MRIAVNASLLDNSPTGLGVYTENVLRELSKLIGERHQLTIYTSCPKKLGPDSQKSRVTKFPFFLQTRYGKKAAVARVFWQQLIFPLTLRGQDIIYSPTHHGILWGGFKQVVTIHDLLAIKFPTQYRLQNYYFTYILPRLIEKATAIIADSENTRQDVHKSYEAPLDKIYVVYSAIDNHFKPAQADSLQKVKKAYGLTEFVLIVGASYPHKNISRALEAFSKVKLTLPKMELVVAGGQAGYINLLKQQAKELNVAGIKFLGYVPPEELQVLYSAARVLLYPSLYEGFGLPPLEAMACGCPVLASNTSSLPEVCGDAAYYIDPHSVDDMAKALCTVATDQNVRDLLRQKGLERVKLFSWEKAAKEIYAVIESVSSQSKPA
jgi:glycosyltransferase involved in cell wall biosynthesis